MAGTPGGPGQRQVLTRQRGTWQESGDVTSAKVLDGGTALRGCSELIL